MNYVKVNCANCNEVFNKTLGEFNRANKNGWQHCCSRSCSISLKNKGSFGNPNISKYSNNRRDENTNFKYFIWAATSRKKDRQKECNICVGDIKDQWNKQRGKCPYTFWQLKLPDNCRGWKGGQPIDGASLDRIDNSKGYVKGNIQFVAAMANFARNKFEEEDLIKFCKAVAKNH